MKATHAVVTLLFLTLSCALYARMPERVFIGTVYNIFREEFRSDEEFFRQVDKDIANIKAASITHIMIFPMGDWDPLTKSLRWERTDYLIEKIEQAGLYFVPLMLKEEQCSHYFPIWKFKEIDGMWDAHNLDNGNINNRQNVDFADPRIFPLVESYFKLVIERYGHSKALSFYNIWNEPHYASSAPHVLERYRVWLMKKYGSLAGLNRSWGEEYTAVEEISPFLNDNWNSTMPQIDWTLFRNELIGMLLQELTTMLRKYDTEHAVNANPVGTSFLDFNRFGFYSVDHQALTAHQDFNGMSYYPDAWERSHGLQPMPHWQHHLAFNAVRSAAGNNHWILTELFTNTQNGLALNGYLDEKDTQLLAWTALANDCKGMIYWKWDPFMRGRQSFGRGLCTVDGQLASRGEGVKKVAQVIARHGEEIYRARLAPAHCAILVDMAGLLKTQEQPAEPETRQLMYQSQAGLFKMLFEKNLGVDLLRSDYPITLQQLQKYKVLFLPFQLLMRTEVAMLLKEYVRMGGWVIADARTAIMDDQDFGFRSTPGAGMQELFGLRVRDWKGKKGSYALIAEAGNALPAAASGYYFQEELIVEPSARILYRFEENGEPAVVMHPFGKGHAVYCGTTLGASYYLDPACHVNELVQKLVTDADVQPDAEFVSETQEMISIKTHRSDKKVIIYAINAQPNPVSGTIVFATSVKTVRAIRNLVTGESVGYKNERETIHIPIKLTGEETAALLIDTL